MEMTQSSSVGLERLSALIAKAEAADPALARGMAIVTRNVSDFQFEGLQVVNPFGGPAR